MVILDIFSVLLCAHRASTGRSQWSDWRAEDVPQVLGAQVAPGKQDCGTTPVSTACKPSKVERSGLHPTFVSLSLASIR